MNNNWELKAAWRLSINNNNNNNNNSLPSFQSVVYLFAGDWGEGVDSFCSSHKWDKCCAAAVWELRRPASRTQRRPTTRSAQCLPIWTSWTTRTTNTTSLRATNSTRRPPRAQYKYSVADRRLHWLCTSLAYPLWALQHPQTLLKSLHQLADWPTRHIEFPQFYRSERKVLNNPQ